VTTALLWTVAIIVYVGGVGHTSKRALPGVAQRHPQWRCTQPNGQPCTIFDGDIFSDCSHRDHPQHWEALPVEAYRLDHAVRATLIGLVWPLITAFLLARGTVPWWPRRLVATQRTPNQLQAEIRALEADIVRLEREARGAL
jgi:hypothetical protein